MNLDCDSTTTRTAGTANKNVRAANKVVSSGHPAKRDRVVDLPTAKIRKRDANATRARILEAAMEEFAARGLPDARIEDVALRAGTNRRMIYYYFVSKEGLYLAALEEVYAGLMNEERKIDVENLHPIEAIKELIRLKVDHYARNPKFIEFLNMENLYKARHLKDSKRLPDFKAPFTNIIARVLERGQRLGVFRAGIDPLDLYISICSLGYLYFSNQYTLGVIFERNMIAPELLEQRKSTISDMVISYLTSRRRAHV